MPSRSRLFRGWKLETSNPMEKKLVERDRKELRALINRKASRFPHATIGVTQIANRIAIKLFLDRVKIEHEQRVPERMVQDNEIILEALLGKGSLLLKELKKVNRITVRNFIQLVMGEYIHQMMQERNAWIANMLVENVVMPTIQKESPITGDLQRRFFSHYWRDMSLLLPEE